MTTIGIIGIGLIGSSIAQGLKLADPGLEFVICDKDERALKTAREISIEANFTSNPVEVAQHCDIIFICTPVRTIDSVAKSLSADLKAGTIITDVGSVKSYVVKMAAPHIPANCHFIPGHPVAGLESAGPENGFPGLFENRNWILTPPEEIDKAAIKKLRGLLEKLNVKNVIEMDPESHDRILGFTSHMPHVIAFAAMMESSEISQDLDIDISRFNGGSYEDMTRVATADTIMWRDIFLTNGDNIKKVVRDFITQMEGYLDLMEKDKIDMLAQKIENARQLKQDQNDKKNTG